MGQLTYDQLGERLAKGGLGGSFFLKAEDEFLRDEAIDLIVREHLQGGSPDFDLDQVNGEDVDPAGLASLLETPPMISRFRVVVVRDGQGLGRGARTVVEDAARRGADWRVMVIAARIPRGSKAKFYDVLSRFCTTVSLSTPRPAELAGWLARRAKRHHGVTLDMEAAQLLAAAIGNRLGVLAQEIEKTVTFVEPRTRIGVEDVRAVVGALPQVDRWKWIDKVAERRFDEAVDELPLLLDSGEWAVGLISALGEALIRIGLAKGGQGALVSALKRDSSYRNLSWKVRVWMDQARGWSGEEIDRALAELLRADRLIKSGGLADRAALEEALLRIAMVGEGAGRRGKRARGG